MTAANIFVLPSLTEGFPLSIVEAMAWGLPIVATQVGGVPELIQDGITGLLCPPRDEDSLAQAILTLVNHPALAQSIGAAAQDFYRNSKFSPEFLGTRFCEVYTKALEIN
jgi:glycosyltransferase involved in cell wall biosynthesis